MRVALLAAFVVGQAGCYKATIADTRVPEWAEAPRESRWESYFLWGIVGNNEEDIRTICPHGQAVMVRQDTGFAAYLDGTLTLGIYSPRNLVVGCIPMRGASVASSHPGGAE